jgi:DNA-binding transcriptional ArsR family regulator
MPDQMTVPRMSEVGLTSVLSALADPLRLGVVRELLRREDGEYACASFDLPIAKSTRTHHWRVLREAGLVTQRDLGNGSTVRLRRREFTRRFPGLLDAIESAPGR